METNDKAIDDVVMHILTTLDKMGLEYGVHDFGLPLHNENALKDMQAALKTILTAEFIKRSDNVHSNKDILRAFGLGYNMGQRNYRKYNEVQDAETVFMLAENYLKQLNSEK